jgi:3-phosphoshikimate 1-carboxyvinyltransferase
MRRVIDPLRRMGARIEASGPDELMPVTIDGGALAGIDYRSPVASAQIKTSLMLAGLQAEGRTSIEEPSSSRDHSERLLEYLGVSIERSTHRVVVKSTNIQNASSLSVPGDLSSAAFLLVAAAILPGSELTVEGVGLNRTRTGILDALRRFGAEVLEEDMQEESGEPRGRVTVRAGDRLPVTLAGDEVVRAIDELPLVAVLGAFAQGDTVIADAAELRVKESDRIATVAAGLETLGVRVTTTPDGMIVHGPANLRGGDVDSAGDHRIAMAMAVAALGADGPTTITGWDAVAVSYPGFQADLESLTER